MKYIGLLIRRETAYINRDGELCNPSETARLLDAINNNGNFTLIELFTNVGQVSGNSKKALYNNANVSRDNGIYFDEIYIKLKK